MTTTDKLLGIRGVMAALHVNRQLPYKWHREGTLKAVTLPGGALRWRQSDIDSLVQGKPLAEKAGQP